MRTGQRTLVFDSPLLHSFGGASEGRAVFETPVIDVPDGFLRAVPSWNVRLRDDEGFRVRMRGRRAGVDSSYRLIGEFGEVSGEALAVEDRLGIVETDEFVVSGDAADHLQLQFAFCGEATDWAERVARISVAFDSRPAANRSTNPDVIQRIAVPFRSQFDDTGELGHRLCSPTCLAMVLSFLDIHLPTSEIAKACYDRRNELYGNWSRAVQAAYAFGVPGYVCRFGDWEEVVPFLLRGRPIVASIRFGHGGLPGSAVAESAGHLVVVTGFGSNGTVLVNDPAFREKADGMCAYPIIPFARAWFAGSGIGYVLGE
jgi:hypothetical protein